MGKPRKRLRKRLRKRIRKRTWLRKDLRWALVLNEEQDIISVFSMRFERVLKNQQVLSRSFPCPRGRNPVCVCVCLCTRCIHSHHVQNTTTSTFKSHNSLKKK